MFAMWDGKPYEKLIWNILKPEWKKLWKHLKRLNANFYWNVFRD
jgi:hypothetical protein